MDSTGDSRSVSASSTDAELTQVLHVLEQSSKEDKVAQLLVRGMALEWAERSPDAHELRDLALKLKSLNASLDLRPLEQVAEKVLQLPVARQSLTQLFAGVGAKQQLPGFKAGWNENMAWRRLDHAHIAPGSYLIVEGGLGRLNLYMKTEDDIAIYVLDHDVDRGFTIRAPMESPQASETDSDNYLGGQARGELTLSDSSLEDGGYLGEKAPLHRASGSRVHPVMEQAAVPFDLRRRPGVEGLLDVAKELTHPERPFMNDDKRWIRLLPDPMAKVETPQKDDPEFAKLFAVPQIQIKEKHIVHVMRQEQDCRLPASHIQAEGLKFEMHQLPNEAARELFWLNAWQNAGQSPTLSSTIVKLSTPACPARSGIKRPYWPLGPQAHEAVKTQVAARKAEVESLRERVKRQNAVCNAASKEALDELQSELKDLEEDLTLAERLYTNLAQELEQQEAETWFGPFEIDGMTVTLLPRELGDYEEIPVGKATVKLRRFKLERKGQKPRIVTQIDYDSWLDFGPTGVRETLELLRLLDNVHGQSSAAPMVHCRAGVGRSGTFVGLKLMLARLRRLLAEAKGKQVIVQDPYEDLIQPVVRVMREQRDQRQVVQQPQQAQQLVMATGRLIQDLWG